MPVLPIYRVMNKVFLHQDGVCINDFVVFVCRYVVTLGAPTSIAQRTEDDTLTYLNKGEGKKVYRFRGLSSKRRPFCIKYVKWKRLQLCTVQQQLLHAVLGAAFVGAHM